MLMYRLKNTKSNLFSLADIKEKNAKNFFNETGFFFPSLRSAKIHIGHCKSKNLLLYNEYAENCVIDVVEVTTLQSISITATIDEVITPETPIISNNTITIEPKIIEKIVPNSVKDDVPNQVEEKNKDNSNISASISVSSSSDNAVY